jgi:phosphotransacetylase
VSAEAALQKGLKSPVAGEADILVAPDLDAANMLAKELEYLGGARSAGIVMGAKVPIILTSRADSADSRVASCAVASVFLHHQEKLVRARAERHEASLEL